MVLLHTYCVSFKQQVTTVPIGHCALSIVCVCVFIMPICYGVYVQLGIVSRYLYNCV